MLNDFACQSEISQLSEEKNEIAFVDAIKRTLVAVIVFITACHNVFGQDPGAPAKVEAGGTVGLVSGIGTHGVVGGSFAVAIKSRFLAIGELSYSVG
jgi:hypothetical protein